MTNVNAKTLSGLFFVQLVMAVLLFVPAGTLEYWQSWAFLAMFAICGLATTLIADEKGPGYLYFDDRDRTGDWTLGGLCTI